MQIGLIKNKKARLFILFYSTLTLTKNSQQNWQPVMSFVVYVPAPAWTAPSPRCSELVKPAIERENNKRSPHRQTREHSHVMQAQVNAFLLQFSDSSLNLKFPATSTGTHPPGCVCLQPIAKYYTTHEYLWDFIRGLYKIVESHWTKLFYFCLLRVER